MVPSLETATDGVKAACPLGVLTRFGSLHVAPVAPDGGRLRRDRTMFYELYNWQVFLKTPSGERRVTGPGLG